MADTKGVTILAIENPEDSAAAVILDSGQYLDAEEVIEQYGAKIERGAFVTLIHRDYNGNTTEVKQLIADRSGDSLYLQDNSFMGDEETAADVDTIGTVVASGYAPQPQLNTYTVFGSDDEGERFANVCKAESPEQAAEQTVGVVLVEEGCESCVKIDIVLAGDYSDAEAVAV